MIDNDAKAANQYRTMRAFRDDLDALVTKYMMENDEADKQSLIGELYAEAAKVSGFVACMCYKHAEGKEEKKP